MKGTSVLNITGTVHDASLRRLVEGVSREVDNYCNRRFYSSVETRYFDGDGGASLEVGDYVSIASLTESDNLDGTYDLAWGASGTNWWAHPYNAKPTAAYDPSPFRRAVINQHTNGTQDVFERGQRNYEVVGTYGYSAITESRGVVASASFDATATAIDFSGGSLYAGETIVIGTEHAYVRSYVGTQATLDRGVNGYTAGVIASGSAVSNVIYPSPITEAVVIQAGRIFKRAQGAFSQEMGLPDAGEIVPMIPSGIDRDVKQMIGAYRKRGGL